ncbi:MAG: hypothetical protein GY754_27665 [bacterium]|nr:hypothetical protein [bacterium]
MSKKTVPSMPVITIERHALFQEEYDLEITPLGEMEVFIMGKKMTWEEMKKNFPDEWLLIVDFELDSSGRIVAGTVSRHSKEKDDVYRLPALNRPSAFRYTGESDFAGVRSHAEKRDIV